MHEDEFAEEIRSHLAHEVDRLIATGVDPRDAEAMARRRFGNVGQLQEQRREHESYALDIDRVRLAWRRLIRTPLFAASAVGMLGLAVAVATLTFSAVYTVAWRPLPFDHPDALVEGWILDDVRIGSQSQDVADAETTRQWRAHQTDFTALSAYGAASFVPQSRVAGRISGAYVDGDFFRTLGVPMMAGRPITRGDDAAGAAPVIVLSQAMWAKAFGSSAAAVGSQWRLGNTEYTIIGVAPPIVDIPGGSIWASMPGGPATIPGSHFVALGRLRAGMSIEQAGAQLTSLIPSGDPATTRRGTLLIPLARTLRRISPVLQLAVGAVALLLAVTLANLGTLFLIRSLARMKRTAIATALGATGRRLRADATLDGALIGAGAAVFGLLTTIWTRRVLEGFVGEQIVQRPAPLPLNAPVIAFAILFAMLTGVTLAILSERVIRTLDLAACLHGGGAASSATPAQSRWRRWLVGIQVASAFFAAVVAVALMRSSRYLSHVDIGYDPGKIVVASLDLGLRDDQSEAGVQALATRITTGLADVAGIDAPTIWTSFGFPMTAPNARMMTAEGSALRMDMDHCRWSNCAFVIQPIAPNFFSTFGVAVQRGRAFGAADRAGSPPVAIINQHAAETWWPGEDPVGKRIRIGGDTSAAPWRTVVGVVANIAPVNGMGPLIRALKPDNIQAMVYQPFTQSVPGTSVGRDAIFVGVRAGTSPRAAVARLRSRLVALFPEMQPAPDVMPLVTMLAADDYTASTIALHRDIALAVTIATLLLALFGIIGVVAESVRHRTRELGVRLALGASTGNVVGVICASALRWLSAGLATGLAGSLVLHRVVARIAFRSSPQFPDGLLLLGPKHPFLESATTALVILGVGLAAAWLPARLAARLDPARVLRADPD